MKGTYDRSVDVLYLSISPAGDVEGEGLEGGVELDFSARTGAPVAVTVLGYRRNGWSDRVSDLAMIASIHLSFSPNEIEKIIRAIA